MPTTDPNIIHARKAGLVYVSDDTPGISRKRSGRGFSYLGPDGRPVKDVAELARIRSLAVPPAYTMVWICPRADGHIQATGRDERGRKQYRYHPGWREIRDLDKYDRMLAFARELPRIRERVEADLRKPGTSREKVLAVVVSLLDRTLIRVGNPEYARSNDSYGLTTLKSRHIDVEGSQLKFRFKGKSGKTWQLSVRDRRIARMVRNIQELPGQALFQYVDEEGEIRGVESEDVNEYLRTLAGEDVSSKDFRTWAGTVLAARELAAIGPYATQKEAKSNIRRAIERVSARLGNTVAVCRKCYVHPQVIASYLDNDLPPLELSTEDGEEEARLAHETTVLGHLERRLTHHKS